MMNVHANARLTPTGRPTLPRFRAEPHRAWVKATAGA